MGLKAKIKTVRFEEAVPDSVDIAYLCVFNSGEWQAIHWGRIEGDSVTFTDMGVSVMYLPALYLNEEIVPWGPPLELRADCETTNYVKRDKEKVDTRLAFTTMRTLAVSTDGVRTSKVDPEKNTKQSIRKTEEPEVGKRGERR